MTTFTSEDREEAEKRQKFMNELQKREPVQLELPFENTKCETEERNLPS
jgi:hypothetical protein